MPEVRGYPDIFTAIMSDDLEAVEEMLASNRTLATSHDGRSPVLLAAYRHRADILAALLRQEPDLDVFEAAAAGVVEALERGLDAAPELLDAYASDGFTLLHLAAFFGHEAAARLLLDRGAGVDAVTRNDLENTPLH